MTFSTNIKLLRTRRGHTQEGVARMLGISRSTLNSYENGSVVNPTLEALVAFSKHFRISIDTLVKVDMSRLGQFQLSELERGHDVFVTGSKLRVLATTVNSDNEENIEVVPLKAKAGYKAGYADPDFIKKLPVFQLPILFNDRKYRMFQLSGDSMYPIPDKSWVIAEYIENWMNIKSGTACVVLTREDGIVFKVIENQIKKNKTLLLKSLNSFYEPYEVQVNEIQEVWKFCNYMSSELPENSGNKDDMISGIKKMENDLKEMRLKLKD